MAVHEHDRGAACYSPGALLARSHVMSEDDLLRAVVDLAALHRCRLHHQRPARTAGGRWRSAVVGDPGWPDLVIAGPAGTLIRELKRQVGRTSPDQVEWIRLLRAGGLDVDVWRPSDLRSGRIPAEIRAAAGR